MGSGEPLNQLLHLSFHPVDRHKGAMPMGSCHLLHCQGQKTSTAEVSSQRKQSLAWSTVLFRDNWPSVILGRFCSIQVHCLPKIKSTAAVLESLVLRDGSSVYAAQRPGTVHV